MFVKSWASPSPAYPAYLMCTKKLPVVGVICGMAPPNKTKRCRSLPTENCRGNCLTYAPPRDGEPWEKTPPVVRRPRSTGKPFPRNNGAPSPSAAGAPIFVVVAVSSGVSLASRGVPAGPVRLFFNIPILNLFFNIPRARSSACGRSYWAGALPPGWSGSNTCWEGWNKLNSVGEGCPTSSW